jgi:hypothetical protein
MAMLALMAIATTIAAADAASFFNDTGLRRDGIFGDDPRAVSPRLLAGR